MKGQIYDGLQRILPIVFCS